MLLRIEHPGLVVRTVDLAHVEFDGPLHCGGLLDVITGEYKLKYQHDCRSEMHELEKGTHHELNALGGELKKGLI